MGTCRDTAFSSTSNMTMLGTGTRALFGKVGAMTCRCSNSPNGCTVCDNGCACLAGLGSGSGEVAEAKVEEPSLPVVKVETAAKDIAVASPTPNDRCFCSNGPWGCTSCYYGCTCRDTAFSSTSNMAMLGTGTRALFGKVGAMTCQCSNSPNGCTVCDNGCACLSGLGSGTEQDSSPLD